jgi:hypothetical protein
VDDKTLRELHLQVKWPEKKDDKKV